MALTPVGVSRISLFNSVSFDFNGSNWVSSGCALAPSTDATRLVVLKSAAPRKYIACSTVQESSTPTGCTQSNSTRLGGSCANGEHLFYANQISTEAKAEKAEGKPAGTKAEDAKPAATTAKDEKAEAKPAAAKPKPAAKAPAKKLPQMMEEDVIPALRSTLEAQDDITNLELTFKDNRLEGSFMQRDMPYTFWAFFPDGVLTGPKGFSLSSYGSEVSTVEPFLIDEKKITPKHVVFWVEKRLAAQGIIPVWEKK